MRATRIYLSGLADDPNRGRYRGLLRSLSARGMIVSVANTQQMGQRGIAGMDRALRACDALLVVVDRYRDVSPRAAFEIGAAAALRKRMILISGARRPAAKRTAFLRNRPEIALRNPAETAAEVAAIMGLKQERMAAG